MYDGENIFLRLKAHEGGSATMSPSSASARVRGAAAKLCVGCVRTPVGSHCGWDKPGQIPVEHPQSLAGPGRSVIRCPQAVSDGDQRDQTIALRAHTKTFRGRPQHNPSFSG